MKLLVARWVAMDIAHFQDWAVSMQNIYPVLRMPLPLLQIFTVTDSQLDYRYEGDNFVLDEQVVRAALKSYKNLQSTSSPSPSQLSPSSFYLRLLLKSSEKPPVLTPSSWKDPHNAICLLEWRAAFMVKELAQHQKDADASANQRVSKAVTDAFVATRVGHMIQELQFADKDKQAVGNLYRLVCEFCLHPPN